MPTYKAPLRDMSFLLYDLFDYETHLKGLTGCEEFTPDLIDSILEESAKFAENELLPINQPGDKGCVWDNGDVKTPAGYKQAYEKYLDSGWATLTAETEYGGQYFPSSIGVPITEMMKSACMPFGMYTGLTHGAVSSIVAHSNQEQKDKYLPNMISGKWAGTMCLTEPHCGTDLGMLKTKAELNADGSYSITGTKIFITGGEHDLTENIVHLVLARLSDAPQGTKGISLFIVPKIQVGDDGSLGERNNVSCGSIEHKMGINGSATCVMNFDGSRGFLIGEANAGLKYMFTMMNLARVYTGMQGLSLGEISYQNARTYAKDRLQMRSLTGPKNPDQPADPIIVHPDVRRMLLTQKVFAEGSRALALFSGMQYDIQTRSQNEESRKEAEDLVGFLTPICKAFMTETGFESVNLGMQVFGGHGYIKEWGMEQFVRDCRISMLYEGTTGIQALDLLGRKVLMSQGQALRNFTKIVHKFCKAVQDDEQMKRYVEPLNQLNEEWGDLTMKIGMLAMKNRDEVGSASVDFLMYSGYIILGYLWARMAKVAQEKLADNPSDADFYRAKINKADFYFKRILPRTKTLADTMLSGADVLMDIPDEQFEF